MSFVQRVSNWLLGDYPVATTKIGSGATEQLIQHVRLTDDSGNYVTPSGGSGGAGDASASNQVLEIAALNSIDGKITAVDTGSIAGTVTANAGTNLNTSSLALEAGGNLAAIKAKTDNIPALGQALAAASTPVVLTAAQLTTLTPPAAITGFATESTLSTLNGKVTACNTGAVTISAALPAGTNAIGKLSANSGVDIGDVDVTSVPADPFGANADAASATGSISAKLRFIAGTGIPITGTVTVGSHAVTNAGTFAVQHNSHGKTVLSAGGSASSSGNNTLVAAGSARIKVSKFSLSTTSTTAMTCIFQSGAGGTELWRVVLQAPTSVSTGANLAVPVPDWIFATASATLLNLNLSSANAVHWSVTYVDEA
jgi:hypothetical protein